MNETERNKQLVEDENPNLFIVKFNTRISGWRSSKFKLNQQNNEVNEEGLAKLAFV